MENKMIKNIVKNIENNILLADDIEYLWNLKNVYENVLLKKLIINETNDYEISLESNIYYPAIYQIESNCPTCGYRTSFSRQKYTEEFITKSIEYRLSDIGKYNISGINCYNKDVTGLRELFLILNALDKYDVDVNVQLYNPEHLDYLKRYNIKSIIYSPEEFETYLFNENCVKEIYADEEKLIKYVKEELRLELTYVLVLNYNETYHDIVDIIVKIKKLGVDCVEIKGFDPFIDSPEEYNPQYSKEYILKIMLILRLYLPEIEIKIKYATNDNNHIEDYIGLGVNVITGIYTPYLNSKLENITEIDEILKK